MSNQDFTIDKIRSMASEGKTTKEIAETLDLNERIVNTIIARR